MTMPNKEDGLTPNALFLTSYAPGTSYELNDPASFNGLTDRLKWRSQPNVVDFLKERVKQLPEWTGATADVFGGLRRGTPGNPVSLPLALAELVIKSLTGFNFNFDSLTHLTDTATLWRDNMMTFLGGLNPLDPSFNVDDAAANFINLVLSPTGLLGGAASAAMDWAALGLSLFGIPGLTQTGVSNSGSNLMSLLGNPLLNMNPASFNPIGAGANLLDLVLSPAGALTSISEIPAHLFSGSVPGASSNILPDPWFSSAAHVNLFPPWSYSTSAPVGAPVGAGSLAIAVDAASRIMKSVPMRIGDPTMAAHDLLAGASLFWSGLTGSGDLVQIAVNSFSDIDLDGNLVGSPLTDPARIIAKLTNPPANSTGTTGADANGFKALSGNYTPPTGTKYAQLAFEILPAATAGTVKFSQGIFSAPNRIDASLLGNIANIPKLLGTSVIGFEGIADMLGTFQHLFDGLGSATTLTPQTGLGFSDLFAAMQALSETANTGGSQGAILTNIIGIRNNKSIGAGANSTSEAMHPISLFGTGAAMTTTSVAAGTAISQTFRASEVAQKGFFEFVASGTSLTNIFTNIYTVDPTTGAKTKLWGSNDVSGLIGTSLGFIKSLIPGSSQPTINAAQNLLLEIANGGSTALTVATRNTGQPNHPSDFPKNLGATRTLASTGGNSPASLTDAQVTYSANHPYVNLGMAAVPNGYVAPQKQEFTANGTWTRPGGFVDGDLVDVFVLGGGGGGQSGGYGLSGSGGDAGHWTTQTFVIGSDPRSTGYPILPNTTTTLAIVVGNGGAGGANPYTFQVGLAGTASTVSGTGITTLTGPPGQGGGQGAALNTGNTGGQGAGNRTIADYTAFGGAATGVNTSASPPGGGGPSGYPAFGAAGAKGKVWVRTRQP